METEPKDEIVIMARTVDGEIEATVNKYVADGGRRAVRPVLADAIEAVLAYADKTGCAYRVQYATRRDEEDVAAANGRGKLAAAEREVADFRQAHTRATGFALSRREQARADRNWLVETVLQRDHGRHNLAVGERRIGSVLVVPGTAGYEVTDANRNVLGRAATLCDAVVMLSATPQYALAARDVRAGAARRLAMWVWIAFALVVLFVAATVAYAGGAFG